MKHLKNKSYISEAVRLAYLLTQIQISNKSPQKSFDKWTHHCSTFL